MKTHWHLLKTEKGWPLFEHGLKVAFGLRREQKWPEEGLEPRIVQGVTIYILSKARAKELRTFHRARAVCPDCHKAMSAGRLRQHTCKGEGA